MKNKKTEWIIGIFIAALSIPLIYVFSYTWDDWAWGSSVGINRLKNWFDNYNGRYLGNILVMILTNSRILKTIIMFLTFVGIFYMMNKITNNKNWKLSLFLLLVMPLPIFRQTVVWASGFANYVFSTFLLLCILNIILAKEEKFSIKQGIFLMFLSIVGSLFIENVTIFHLIFSLLLTIYYFFIKRKEISKSLFYLSGSLIGTIIMFSNSVYLNIQMNKDGYRGIALTINDIIFRVKENYINLIIDNFFDKSIIILTFLFIIAFIVKFKNNKTTKFQELTFNILCVSYTYFLFKFFNPTWAMLLKYTDYVDILFSLLYIISLYLTFVININKQEKIWKITIYFIILFLTTMPLLIVTPLSPRNLFLFYIILILINQEMLSIVIDKKKNIFLNRKLNIIIILILIFYSSIYYYTFSVEKKVSNYTKVFEGKVIEHPYMPYSDYFHEPNLRSLQHFKKGYLEIHGRNDIEDIKIIEYKEWLKKYKKYFDD